MEYKFDDYKIHIGNSNNYADTFVCYIEEFHCVVALIENKDQAERILKPLFENEVIRLKNINAPIPRPGSGKATVTFATNDKIKAIEPLVIDFWEKILSTSYNTSFVSDNSYLQDWEHYLTNGKTEIIEKVKIKYNVDIEPIYNNTIWQVLTAIKNKT